MLKKICFVVIAGLTFAISGCNSDERPIKEIIRPVRFQTLTQTIESDSRSFSGISAAASTVDLSFRVGGIIRVFNFKIGVWVKAGDLLATLDDNDARLELEKAGANVNQSKVQLQTAESNLGRIKKLFEDNNVALSEYEDAKDRFASAKANEAALQKTYQILNSELSYYKLYAPMDGIVAEKNGGENENVQAGNVVFVLHGKNQFNIDAGLPEQYVSRVEVGDKVSAEFGSIPNKVYECVISEIALVMDKKSSTYPITMTVSNPDEQIRADMTANVRFSFSDSDDGGEREALIVPMFSVGKDNAGNFSFVVIPDASEKGFGKVIRKSIVIGKILDNGFEIKSGLEVGDMVVTAGVSKLEDGAKVRIQN